MLNHHGFDLWSGHYDAGVKQADDNNEYPFAGYTALMNSLYATIMAQPSQKVLDIGFGTGLLASKLYDHGHRITGIDFSPEMIAIAREKMPAATLLQWDFTKGLPPYLEGQAFADIVSTYALHHLTDEQKVPFILSLLPLLNPNGTLFIGDVAFLTREELLSCQRAWGDLWDEEEHYFVFSELEEPLAPLCSLAFHPFSFCAGVIEIKKLSSL